MNLIDPTTARKLGKIAGAEALITGTLTPLGESVKITVKLLDTETAALIDANRGNIPMTDAIKKLMETGVGSSAGQKTPGYKPPKPGKSQQSKVVENFTFDLLSCKISDRTVTITLMITNNADDRKLSIVSETRLYDDLGNEYQPGDVKIANTKASLWRVGSSRGYLHYVGKELISGVPTKTIFPFQKVNSEATMATSFKIYCKEGGSNKRFWVNFRNIPLTK